MWQTEKQSQKKNKTKRNNAMFQGKLLSLSRHIPIPQTANHGLHTTYIQNLTTYSHYNTYHLFGTQLLKNLIVLIANEEIKISLS